jgi:hypothetical protein
MKKMAGLQRNAGEDKDDRRQREHDKEMARIAAQVETPAIAKAVPLRSSRPRYAHPCNGRLSGRRQKLLSSKQSVQVPRLRVSCPKHRAD